MRRVALKDQISRGGHDAAIPWARVLKAPDLLLMNRIPGEEKSLLALKRVLECLPFAGGHLREVNRHVVADRGLPEVLVGREREPFLLCRDIDQPGLRVERHWLPVMPAARRGSNGERLAGLVIARRRYLHRAAGFRIDTFRPVDRHEVVRRD